MSTPIWEVAKAESTLLPSLRVYGPSIPHSTPSPQCATAQTPLPAIRSICHAIDSLVWALPGRCPDVLAGEECHVSFAAYPSTPALPNRRLSCPHPCLVLPQVPGRSYHVVVNLDGYAHESPPANAPEQHSIPNVAEKEPATPNGVREVRNSSFFPVNSKVQSSQQDSPQFAILLPSTYDFPGSDSNPQRTLPPRLPL
jgi:hypothetical protein